MPHFQVTLQTRLSSLAQTTRISSSCSRSLENSKQLRFMLTSATTWPSLTLPLPPTSLASVKARTLGQDRSGLSAMTGSFLALSMMKL